ncbi:hypothetical protein Peur_036254 [Populus x canadensis]
MLQHFHQTSHCLALSYSDLSVWCYACDSYLDARAIMQLKPVSETAYILKFGGAPPFRLVARTPCDHSASLSSDLAHIPAPDTPCNRCHHPSENWLCLSCKDVLCSRFVNKHMLQHFHQTSHCLALSYSDLSVWCYACNSYLDARAIMQLKPVSETAYILKFGGAPPFCSVARTPCDHSASLSSDLAQIPAPNTPCNRCHHPSENWLCLSCKDVLCSRFVNKHMLQHFHQTSHCLALSYSDLSVWCYACDSYLDARAIMQLKPVSETAYILKFGGAPPFCSVARTPCDHSASLSSDLAHIPAPDTPCNRCHHPSENWLCLSCKDVLCSRFVNKHMLQHFHQTSHCLALSYSDLSVWCYACDSYIDARAIMQLKPVSETAYILKFGGAPPFRWVARTPCDHSTSLSSDLAHIPAPDTPCNL